ALLIMTWAGLSFRPIDGAGSVLVADFPLLGTTPMLVKPGWRFVPCGFCRISEYPATSRKLKTDLTGEGAARSREGAKVEVEVELTYTIPPEGVLELHRKAGPSYES